MTPPTFTEVENWLKRLPAMVVADVEQVPDRNAQFNFLVRDGSDRSVNVIAQQKDGPLLVGANATLDDETLDAVRRHGDQFHLELSAVLTNTPGIYSYTDTAGQSVSFDEFDTISLRHWIYPDGLSEHELNTTVIDTFQTLAFIESCAQRLPSRQEKVA